MRFWGTRSPGQHLLGVHSKGDPQSASVVTPHLRTSCAATNATNNTTVSTFHHPEQYL